MRTPGNRLVVLVMVPGLQGGVDEAAKYMVDHQPDDARFTSRIVTTKGRVGWRAPLVLAKAVATMLRLRARGELAGVHLNMSSRGSAARKAIVASVADLAGVRYVIQLHGGGFGPFLDTLHPLGRRWLRRVFSRAERVAVLGTSFAELLQRQLDLPADSIVVVPNGVAVPEPPARDPEQPPLIVHVGRLSEAKGTFLLLDALTSGPLAGLEWRAVLAGDGDTERALAQVIDAGLGDRISVSPWISRDEVSRLLARADIFALPSHAEAMSLSLLEAMACGLTCLTTPVGAHGDVIADDENGLLVEPSRESVTAALVRVVEDPALRQRLGSAAGTSFTERFDIRRVVTAWDQLYEEAFGS